MPKRKEKIGENDELDLQCLAIDIDICPYRFALNTYFGHDIKMECRHRVTFKRKFKQYLADKEHKKFHDEYPGDVPDIKP